MIIFSDDAFGGLKMEIIFSDDAFGGFGDGAFTLVRVFTFVVICLVI